jgi:phage I-like protein
MKKLFSLFVASMALLFSLQAQPPGGGDPEAMKARMKERVKPLLIQQVGVSDAEADKILEINFDFQMKTRELRMDQALSEDDRKKKMKELNDNRDKKVKEIPLSDEKVKAVNTFYEEMRKRQQEARGNRGN